LTYFESSKNRDVRRFLRQGSGLAVYPGVAMFAGIAIQPVVALIAGILILVMPRLLNYIVALYLILIGILGLVKF
jgi:hypothetical protein